MVLVTQNQEILKQMETRDNKISFSLTQSFDLVIGAIGSLSMTYADENFTGTRNCK